MKVEECSNRLNDLRTLMDLYKRLYSDPYKSLYKDTFIKKLMNKTYSEILRLEDLMYNMELDNSYDQNTGELHEFYKG